MLERGSTRHSQRVDDELGGEVESLVRGAPVESRADEWRQMEAAAEGEPRPGAVVSVDQVELRSLLATSLRPSAFPATRDHLLEVAREERAEDGVLEWLSELPAAVTFGNVQSVWETLGGARESRARALDEVVPTEQSNVAPEAPLVPASEPPGATYGRSLIDRGARVALVGAAVVVGLTIAAVRAVLRKR